MDNLRIDVGSFTKVETINQIISLSVRFFEIEQLTKECRFLEIDSGFGNTVNSFISISGYNNLTKIQVNKNAMNSILKLIISNNKNLNSILISTQSCRNVRQLTIASNYNN